MLERIQAEPDVASTTDSGRRQQLLHTKLRPPRAATDGVMRPRLMQELERGTASKLTLIVTPPGFGKSTLVNQWQIQTSKVSAWVSLDPSDNDFLVFLDYVTAAVRLLDPTLCPRTVKSLQSPSPPPAHELMNQLINELSEPTQPFVLVLDDFHLITSPEVQAAVLQLVNDMPPNLSVIITSRVQPALPTLTMHARGELVALTAGDLSFTDDEALVFLVERQGLDLRASQVSTILQWADGWPVALRLAANSLRNRPPAEVDLFLGSLTDHVPVIADYLWQEVIDRQSPRTRAFLLQTSILHQFNPELCQAVTGAPDAGQTLAELDRSNLFITRLHGPGNWYRYHHLFSEALRQLFTQEVDAAERAKIHSRAARWYDDKNLIAEAAHHAVEAENWELAAPLLVHLCKEMYDRERVGNLYRWLKDLPDDPFVLEPRLGYLLTWAAVRTGHPREATRQLAILEEHTTAETARASLQLRLLRSLYDRDADTGERAAELILEQLGPEDDSDRARALIILGMLRNGTGQFAEANLTLAEAHALSTRLGIRGFQVAELAASGLGHMALGRLNEGAERFRRVIAIADEWNDLPLLNAHHKLGTILYEWNRLDEAREQAAIVVDLAHRMDAPIHFAQAHELLAKTAMAEGRWDVAFDEIDLATASAASTGFQGAIPAYEELKCRMWLLSDQLTLAQGWLGQKGPGAFQAGDYGELDGALTAHRIRLHEGRAAEIGESLRNLEALADANSWEPQLLRIRTLQAMIEFETGNTAAARAAIGDAVAQAAPEGYVRTFLDEGERVTPLLSLALGPGGAHHAYVTSLLEAAGSPHIEAPAHLNGLEGMLSPRERDVMELVAGGFSNREIGDALFISEETVKTHLRRIFEKLNVSSRTQAIHRTRQLGML